MKLSQLVLATALVTLTTFNIFIESADAQRTAQRYSRSGSRTNNGNDLDDFFGEFAIFEEGIEDTLSSPIESLFPGAIAFYLEQFNFETDGIQGMTQLENLDLFVSSFDNTVFYEFQIQGITEASTQGTFNPSDLDSAVNDLSFIANNFPFSEDIDFNLFPNSSSSLLDNNCFCFDSEQTEIEISSVQPVTESYNSLFAFLTFGTLSYGLWKRPRKV